MLRKHTDYNPIYLITHDFESDQNSYLAALESSLKNGIKLVQFRSKNLAQDSYKNLAKEVVKLVHDYNGKVLLNSSMSLLDEVDADGIHFPSSVIADASSRPLPDNYIVSVACHNLEQIQHANTINPSFAVLCPVFATPSSPKGIPIGWDNFKNIVSQATFPVYALGGLSLKDFQTARQHGAHGLAAKRGLWNLQQPVDTFCLRGKQNT